MKCILIVTSLSLAAGLSTTATAGELCDTARTVASDQVCVETPFGVVVAPNEARARQLATFAAAGEARFRRHFNRDASRYALIETEGRAEDADRTAALKRAGFPTVLPWLARDAQIAAQQASLRSAVEESATRNGASADRIEAMVQSNLANLASRHTPEAMDASEAGIIPHELAHSWLVNGYWPSLAGQRPGHYGGPAPDWMDEISALLAEDDRTAELRRKGFADIYTGNGGPGSGPGDLPRLLDLKAFLGADHPLAAAQQTSSPSSQIIAGAGQRSVSVVRSAGQGGGAGLFYVHARMFADFLMDKTSDPAVFSSIAQALAQGRTFEAWLGSEGRASGLSPTLDGLNDEWRAWLTTRLGAPRTA